MKISKVNHMRTAVTVAEKSPKGILYVHPSKSEYPKRNIKKVYDERNDQAAKLYGILNPARKTEKKEVKSVHTAINKLIKQLLSISVEGERKAAIKEQLKFLTSDDIYNYAPRNGYATDEQIKKLVTQYLRKSLRMNATINSEERYLPDIISKFIIKLQKCWRNHDNTVLSDPVEKKEIEDLLQVIVNDWYKLYKSPKKKRDTVHSIEEQRALVKVIYKNGHTLLAPSNSTHEKKSHVFAFMRAYVAGSEEDRRRMLIAMRTMLTVYLRGDDNLDVVVNEKSFLSEFSPEHYLCADISASFDEISRMESRKKEICEQLRSFGKKLNKREKKKKSELEKEKNSIDKDIDKTNVEIRLNIERILKAHYRTTLAVFREKGFSIDDECRNYCSDLLKGGSPKITAAQFWLDYFDEEARKILLQGRRLDTYKTGLLWLGKRIWGNWTSYIAQKFIDYGKTVYHFVLPEEFEFNGRGLRLGDVLPEYQKGISSFEYERLKARDDLNRNIAVAVTCAASTFSRAVLESIPKQLNTRSNMEEPEEDILFIGEEVYGKNLYKDAGKRILRYFGGASRWEKNTDINRYAGEDNGIKLIDPIRIQLKDLRNSSFHYLSVKSCTDTTVIRLLFDQEKDTYPQFVREKYFSNNVYRYYSEENTKQLLDFLYKKPAHVPAKIPAFQRLFNRESAYMHSRILDGNSKNGIAGNGTDEIEIFKGTLLFLLKEIYYKAFLQDPACKNKFMALVRRDNENKVVENKRAFDNFKKRIDTLGKGATLGEICELIMTDYQLQNRDKQVRKSGNHDREIYKHFRSLLYLYIKEAFIDYLLDPGKAEYFGFISKPAIVVGWENIKAGNYLDSWTCDTYKDVLQDESMLKWYTLAHFLTPKQVNHLIGSYKRYEVFINAIDGRAGVNNNRTDKTAVSEETRRVKGIIDMLAFSANFCARTTNNVKDYFENDEDNATVISEFVQLDNNSGTSKEDALQMFCDRELNIKKMSPDGNKTMVKQRIGIYKDAKNTIANSNVERALMYGDIRMLSKVCDRVTEQDVLEYYKRKEDLANVFKAGACVSLEEQKKLREFQNMKNRIELHDLLTYTEMISDLNGQLVNWSYFRERDLMYMQLGVQYTKLFFTDARPEDKFRRKISGDGFAFEEGAILYQIVAMYDYGLPLYGFDKQGNGKISVKAGVSPSGCIGGFVKDYCGETFNNPTTYHEGLYFFENIGEHDAIVDTRNYIDHFKYYANHERSLLDLYSEIYERFFGYSRNFKKSVSFILPNILEQYFVVLNIEMAKGERPAVHGNETSYHDVAAIRIKGVSSDNFSYKIKVDGKEKTYRVPVRTNGFLRTVQKILEYKAEN